MVVPVVVIPDVPFIPNVVVNPDVVVIPDVVIPEVIPGVVNIGVDENMLVVSPVVPTLNAVVVVIRAFFWQTGQH
jgi:hypothetical protein